MKKDTITKNYISDNEIFADIFNYYIYNGEQVIKPAQLSERDPVSTALPYGADGAVVPVQKLRDVQKLCAMKTDGKLGYILYGAEAQSEIHYAMAVKNNLYDVLGYAGQVEEASKSHRKEMKKIKETKEEIIRKPSSAEFLSGFWKDDRLIPSVTVTVYFGSNEWDGPLSLFDMMDIEDKRVLPYLNDYRVHLIAPAQMADADILKFQSSLREVFLFIKYSRDSKKLAEILKKNEKRFSSLERRAADVIEAMTNTGLKYGRNEVSVDMCKAIQEIREEERRIGEEAGRKLGEEAGRKIGEEAGKKTGEEAGKLKKAMEMSKNLYEMGMEPGKIAQASGYAVETVKEWLGIPLA